MLIGNDYYIDVHKDRRNQVGIQKEEHCDKKSVVTSMLILTYEHGI